MISFTDLKVYTKIFVGHRPRISHGILIKLFSKHMKTAVQKGTDIVIESYARSANSFATQWFILAQVRNYNIAHHLHIPAQIIKACKWNIPTLLLIRNPKDAVLSTIVRHPDLSAKTALKYYISFYKNTLDYRSSVVIGHFTSITTNYGQIIEKINQKYGTGFTPFDHTQENVKRVF